MFKICLIKLNIIFIALLIPILSKSQKMDLIFDLKWNMNETQVINQIKKVRRVLPSKKTGNTFISTLHYDNQHFDNHKSVSTILYFQNMKLLFIEIYFAPNPNSTISLFDSIKNTLAEKYFQPQVCKDDPTFCDWFFPEDDPDAKKGFLNLAIVNNGLVLVYQQQKTEKYSDF